jgi:uncharacterized protein (TIRG00374 family)
MAVRTDVPEMSRDELPDQPNLDRKHIRRRLLGLAALIVVVVAVITLVPGLAELRSRFADAKPGWLLVGCLLKVLSGLSYVAAFRAVFCRRMSWRLSTEIGLSELGANAILPTGGVGGLALGVWALRRTGMSTDRIARRTVAFFFLTSVPNVVGVIVIGLGMAVGILEGPATLALTLLPALIATGAIVLTIAGGRWARKAEQRAADPDRPRERARRVLGTLSGGVEESLALLRQHDPWLVIGLIGYLGFDVMILWSTFHAFGASPSLSVIWIGYLIGELGGLIPVPGGIGGVDLGLVGTLALYKVPLGAATAAVLGYRAIALWVPAVLGSVAFVMLRRSLTRETIAISDCEPGGEVDVIGRGLVRLRT